MRLIAGIGAAVGVLWTAAAYGALSITLPTSNVSDPELQGAITKLQHGDIGGGIGALEDLVGSARFSSLSPPDQYSARTTLALLDYQLGDCNSAVPLLKLATTTQWAGADVWVVRFACAVQQHDSNDEDVSLTGIAQHGGLAQLRDGAILEVAERNSDSPDHAALLRALFAAHWAPADLMRTNAYMLRQLVLLRLAGGDIAGASDVAGQISDANVLATMRIDRRFDAVVQANPAHFDIAKALDADLADLRAKSAAAPDKLAGIARVALQLLGMNRAAEALALVNDALARAKTSAFSDLDQLDWIEDYRANALLDLGRYDEALAQMAAGANTPEQGGSNVSQKINLAAAYNDLAQPQKALDAVSDLDVGRASPFGRMQLLSVRACAYAQLKDTANLSAALDDLKAHQSDAAGTYAWTLLCAGNIDDAAAAFASEIENPDTRIGTLYGLQDFTPSPFAPPFAAETHRRMIEMRSRPVLAAVIAKYGRVESIPMIPVF